MGFIIKEFQEEREKQLALITDEMIKKEAKRYGGSLSSPESEKQFILKIKAVRSQLQNKEEANLAIEEFVKNLKNSSLNEGLLTSNIKPNLLLDLL